MPQNTALVSGVYSVQFSSSPNVKRSRSRIAGKIKLFSQWKLQWLVSTIQQSEMIRKGQSMQMNK